MVTLKSWLFFYEFFQVPLILFFNFYNPISFYKLIFFYKVINLYKVTNFYQFINFYKLYVLTK